MSLTPGSPRVFGINVVIRSSGQLGILTKYIPSYGQQIRIIQHNSPFASCLQVYDLITHWNKIPVSNMLSVEFQKLVNQSQQNGQFALVIARYSEPLEVPGLTQLEQNKNEQASEPTKEVQPTQLEQKKNESTPAVVTKSNSSVPPPTSQPPPPKSNSIQKRGKSFEKRLEEFKLYKEKYGTVDIDGTIDKTLKNWTINVRYAYNKRMESMKNNQPLDMPNGGLKLDETKIQLLKEAGFRFEKYKNRKKSSNRLSPVTSMANDDSSIANRSDTSEGPEKVRRTRVRKSFEQRIEDMKKFIEENGHSFPSQEVDSTLYHWASNIRNAYAAMEKGKEGITGIKLDEERMKMLNEIGFQFKRKRLSPGYISVSHPRGSTVDAEAAFDKRVADMKAFIEKNGHSFPSKSHGDPSLINWCANVRSAYRWQVIEKISKGMNISSARIDKLKAIGFDFGTQGLRVRKSSSQNSNEVIHFNDKFDKKVEELKKFKLVHGHLNVPKNEEYASLAGWIGNVKAARRYLMKGEKKGMKLDTYRIQALDRIGFNWGAGINKAIQNDYSFEAGFTMKPPVRSVISTKNADAWLLNSNTIKINTVGHSLLGAKIRKSPSRGGFIVVEVGESSPFRGRVDVGEVITHLQGRNMYSFQSTEVAAFLKTIIGGEIYVTLKKRVPEEKRLEYKFEEGIQRTIQCPKSNSTLGLALQYIESLEGFLVTGMLEESPLKDVLDIGDVITEIDGSKVTPTTMKSLMTNDSDTKLFTIKRIESNETNLLSSKKCEDKERYFIRKGDRYKGSGISKIVGEPSEKGLLISDIDPVGSLTSGIHVGDLIVKLNEDELSFLPPRHKFGRNLEIHLNKDDTYNIVFHRADKKTHLQEKSNVLSDVFLEEEVPFLDISKLPQVQAFDANSKDSIREANATNLKLQKENNRQLLGKRKIVYSLKRSVKPRNFKIVC